MLSKPIQSVINSLSKWVGQLVETHETVGHTLTHSNRWNQCYVIVKVLSECAALRITEQAKQSRLMSVAEMRLLSAEALFPCLIGLNGTPNDQMSLPQIVRCCSSRPNPSF